MGGNPRTLTKLLRGIARAGPTRIGKGMTVAGSASIVLATSMVGPTAWAHALSIPLTRDSVTIMAATGPTHTWNGCLRRCHLSLISPGSLTTNSLPLDARLNPARTARCHVGEPPPWLRHQRGTARAHAPQQDPCSCSIAAGGCCNAALV